MVSKNPARRNMLPGLLTQLPRSILAKRHMTDVIARVRDITEHFGEPWPSHES